MLIAVKKFKKIFCHLVEFSAHFCSCVRRCRAGERFSIMSNGDLHIRDVTSDDSHKPLRCTTYNTLTNDTRASAQARLYVIGNLAAHTHKRRISRY